MMQQSQTTFGQLTCRVVQPAGKARAAAVLCHGYGAPGEDLLGLGQACLDLDPTLAESVAFIYPQAPLSLADLGMPWGRAWWHLDVARLMARRQGGPSEWAALRKETPGDLTPARRLLRGAIDAALQQLGLSYDKLILGGFSQGAMLACDVALRLEEAPASLVQLSGTLIDEAAWTARARNRRGLHVLQSHGKYDPILPFENAEALRDMLTQAGLDVDFVAFQGEHSIPAEALTKLAAVCRRVAA